MKNKKNCESMSALKLALIITGSIVAAAGIVVLILSICKKKCHKKHVCDCCDAPESNDSWDIDEDALGELELDDDDCCCDECGAHDAEEDGEPTEAEAETEEKADDAE